MTYTEIAYDREGWGICAAGRCVITSDGSSELVLRDPGTLAPRRVITVGYDGDEVQGLNDLAWSSGRVWANVAGTSHIMGIDPASGKVTDVVDAKAAGERHVTEPQAIMNGIAALPAGGEFLVTGKGWRLIRHVRLAPDGGPKR
jgi:glutaminyl-peptide cyclotransferase